MWWNEFLLFMKWQLFLLIGIFLVIHGLWAQDPAAQIRPGQEGYQPEAPKTVFISVPVNQVSFFVIRADRQKTVSVLLAGGALRRWFTWSMV
ncbi:MAG TPA: hypothetical protein DIC22_06120 [Chitinophagaceae bacterium]|nr:hypothetical protein [Chitinophagaceae bacterium]